jgi:hypothetical protein
MPGELSDAARDDLEDLRSRFLEGADDHRGLKHALIVAPDTEAARTIRQHPLDDAFPGKTSTPEPQRREGARRLRNRANAALLSAPSDPATAEVKRRADDLEYGSTTRAAVVAALIERDGGVDAFVAREAAGLAPTWPYATALGLARRDAVEAARGGPSCDAAISARAEVARLEAAGAAWCRQQAGQLVGLALSGDVQACFRLFARHVAAHLAGPAVLTCAYLADAEDHPED